MAKNRNTRRRRRGRGRLGSLLRLLSIVLTAVVIVAALTLFFKIEEVTVSGNGRYTAEEIVSVCGVRRGDNLILLDKYGIASRLYTSLPYITNVRINRAFPDRLTVEVTETTASLAIQSGGAWWLVSSGGKIVEMVDESGVQGVVLLQGLTAQEILVGSHLMLAEEDPITVKRLTELVNALQERNMLERVTCIDASNQEILVLAYDGRFSVELSYDTDFEFKLDCLKAVVDELEPNETGIIRMTMDDKNEVRFIPYKK